MTTVDVDRRPADLIAAMSVRNILGVLDDDPDREGLADTPRRVVDALVEMTEGRHIDPATILAVAFDPGYPADEMVLIRGVEFVSVCEHHLMPFTGTADVAYIPGPDHRVVGLSKLARLVDAYARRLQLQERMTRQIVDALVGNVAPSAACVVRATHGCMASRGIRRPGATMVTSALAGDFRDDPATRAEFMSLTAR